MVNGHLSCTDSLQGYFIDCMLCVIVIEAHSKVRLDRVGCDVAVQTMLLARVLYSTHDRWLVILSALLIAD
jgi:hypothetical protein